ncbi:NADPH-dependent FMN reductase [Candidatus Fermentibacteria bacterium]|nr:NADPH-dependent FMN reductase [Candidatus Fermentibacteria bacterium]
MGFDIAVLYGSSRTERVGIRAARFVVGKLRERGHEATLLEPLEYELPPLDYRYYEYEEGRAPERIERVAEVLKRAEAYVFVTGEYNHGIPPMLKNMIDHFLYLYFFKPSGIVSYSTGNFGGVREAVQLRATLGEIGTVSIPTMLPVPRVDRSFDEDGKPRDERYHDRITQFLDELEWYADALKRKRAEGTPY